MGQITAINPTAVDACGTCGNESNEAHETHANGEHDHAHTPASEIGGKVDLRYRETALNFGRDHNAKRELVDDRDERDHDDHKLIVLLLSPHRLCCN